MRDWEGEIKLVIDSIIESDRIDNQSVVDEKIEELILSIQDLIEESFIRGKLGGRLVTQLDDE